MNQEIIKLLANIVRTYQDDAPQTQIAADGGSSPIPNNILTEKLDLLGKRTDIKIFTWKSMIANLGNMIYDSKFPNQDSYEQYAVFITNVAYFGSDFETLYKLCIAIETDDYSGVDMKKINEMN